MRGTQPDRRSQAQKQIFTRSDLESGDIRSDSPTTDIEAQNLMFSFAASRKVKIGSADITNAYFQGEEFDRLLILKQPKGGLPGQPPDKRFLARVPVYGTHDGGRKFWKCLKVSAEHSRFPYLETKRDESSPHVNDQLWAAETGEETIIERLVKEFSCGKF